LGRSAKWFGGGRAKKRAATEVAALGRILRSLLRALP